MFSKFGTFLRHDLMNLFRMHKCAQQMVTYVFHQKELCSLEPDRLHQKINFQNNFEKRISRCSSTFCLHPLLGKTASNGQISKLFRETNFKVLQDFLPESCSRESDKLIFSAHANFLPKIPEKLSVEKQ